MSRPEPPAVDERPRVSRTLAVVLALLTLAGLAGVYLSLSREQSQPSRAAGGLRGSALPEQLTRSAAPRIRLRDGDGRLVDTRALAGTPYAVTFLYTQCPDVCPLIGEQVKQGLERLGAAARDVTVLIVSVDPRGDTPAAVRAWMRRHRMPSNVRYLVGSLAELRPVWEGYYAAPQDVARPQTSTHSAAVWLIGADGRRRTKLDAGQGIRPEDFAHDVRLLRRAAGGR